MLFLYVLSGVITSHSASLSQLCVLFEMCVCGLAVCLLYFHMSHWVISVPVIAIATMPWHMPPSWLPDWQGRCRGEIQRMLEQITPLPLPSSEWQTICRSSFPPLFWSFTIRKCFFSKPKTGLIPHSLLCEINLVITDRNWPRRWWKGKQQGEETSRSKMIWSFFFIIYGFLISNKNLFVGWFVWTCSPAAAPCRYSFPCDPEVTLFCQVSDLKQHPRSLSTSKDLFTIDFTSSQGKRRKKTTDLCLCFNQHKHRPSCRRRYRCDSKGIWGKFLSESNLDSSPDADENCNPEAYFHLSELRWTCFCLVLWQLFRYVLKRSVVTGWVWNKNRKESVVLVWWRRFNKST